MKENKIYFGITFFPKRFVIHDIEFETTTFRCLETNRTGNNLISTKDIYQKYCSFLFYEIKM